MTRYLSLAEFLCVHGHLFEAVKAGATPQVSASCRTLMRAYGLSDARIDGRG